MLWIVGITWHVAKCDHLGLIQVAGMPVRDLQTLLRADLGVPLGALLKTTCYSS